MLTDVKHTQMFIYFFVKLKQPKLQIKTMVFKCQTKIFFRIKTLSN